MKKLFVASLCLFLASIVVVPHRAAYSQARSPQSPAYVRGEIIVKLKAEVADLADQDIPEFILRAPGAQAERLSQRQRGLNLVRLNGRLSVEQAVAAAQADPRVEYAEPNYLYEASVTQPNDPRFSDEWGLMNSFSSLAAGATPADIGATRAWDITTGSDDMVVAIIDTGVDISHEDLAANIWTNPQEVAGNGVDDDGDQYIDDVHGWNFRDNKADVFVSASEDLHATHVAGTIGAVGNNQLGIAGVAWHVKLMSLKFLGGSKGSGSTADALRAIDYVLYQKSHGVNVRVINASWGGPGASQALRDKIQEAGDNGVVFVCSAGNDSADNDGTSPDYPAAFAASLSNVISVAAIDIADNLADFSNYGHAATTIGAPGQSILSTVPHTSATPNGGYSQLSGTSMASPHVAGVVALLLSNEPQLTPAQVKQRLIATAEPTDDLASRIAASGRVNAYNALTNTVVPPARPHIKQNGVRFSKTTVTVDGFGFVNGSAVVEVNGNALDGTAYDSSYATGNGRLTRLTIELGKKPMKKKFPIGQPASVTVFNPTTGERSATVSATRF
jgi:subtilisin family serine protease